MEGYWVRTSVKVGLTKEEKQLIGRHSSPRWELDIVAYSGRDNLLRIVECKSYFDSAGVRASCFDGSNPDHGKRYKLFNEPELRRVVFNRLCFQFTESGACQKEPKVRLALAAGKIRSEADRTAIRAHFDAEGWDFWDERGCVSVCSACRNRVTKTKSRPWLRNCFSGEKSNKGRTPYRPGAHPTKGARSIGGLDGDAHIAILP